MFRNRIPTFRRRRLRPRRLPRTSAVSLCAALLALANAGCAAIGPPVFSLEHDRRLLPRGQSPVSQSENLGKHSPYHQKMQALIDRAARQYGDGKLKAARASLRTAQKFDPFLGVLWELDANVALDEGDRDGYVASLVAVAETNPESARLQNAVGSLLVATGSYRDGFAALRQAVELQPANAVFARDLAAAWTDRGDVFAADAVLTEAMQQNPIDESLPIALARLHEWAENWNTAAFYYEMALANDPETSLWRRQRGRCLFQAGEYRDAYADFKFYLAENRSDASVVDYVHFGVSCLRTRDYQEAQKAFDEVSRRSDQRLKEVEVLRGLCALHQGNTTHAKGIVTTALTYWSDDESLHRLLELCASSEPE